MSDQELDDDFAPMQPETPRTDPPTHISEDVSEERSSDLSEDSSEQPPEQPPEASNEESNEEPKVDFEESNTAFQEIQDFGENVFDSDVEEDVTEQPAAQSPLTESVASVPAPEPESDTEVSATQWLMGSGESLTGYEVEKYFSPISVSVLMDQSIEDPLQPAYEKLWKKTQATGGNGILSLKWVTSADLTRVVMSGTPVHVKRS